MSYQLESKNIISKLTFNLILFYDQLCDQLFHFQLHIANQTPRNTINFFIYIFTLQPNSGNVNCTNFNFSLHFHIFAFISHLHIFFSVFWWTTEVGNDTSTFSHFRLLPCIQTALNEKGINKISYISFSLNQKYILVWCSQQQMFSSGLCATIVKHQRHPYNAHQGPCTINTIGNGTDLEEYTIYMFKR